ncbi:MAG: Do family serine endopeptidase [Saprospiraceae bacterium]|nr:Do family serine endopeptidase [Saprospiraceae bacterium]
MMRFSQKINQTARTYLFSGLIALLVTVAAIGVHQQFGQDTGKTIRIEHVNGQLPSQVLYTRNSQGDIVPLDFRQVAQDVMGTVVHIKSTHSYTGYRQQHNLPNPFEDLFRNDPFREFFNPRFFYRNPAPQQPDEPPMRVGQGSGVIISADGYIVTNNHVVADAMDLEVTLHDNRTYKATLVGTDPTTDLALIRINEKDLPTLPLVDSDEVHVGEWVLAVGNPFNLTSTVTAGIVSAKGRNINLLRERFAVESFIQTDAAINPGNSGGALVNLQGGLIGINTAIASPTGAYSGYGFAIPSNIVSKVVEDLINYGVVQRGVLGVMIRTVDGNLRADKDLSATTGVYVDSLLENSAAGSAGVRVGDVILSVNGQGVQTSPQLQEIIARHRPGDVVTVEIDRKGKIRTFDITLNNRRGNTEVVKKEHKDLITVLGAELETLDQETADRLDIKGGVRVTELYAGKLRRNTNLREGFVITRVDGREVTSVEDLMSHLEGKEGGVMLEGVYPDLPGVHYYAFGM